MKATPPTLPVPVPRFFEEQQVRLRRKPFRILAVADLVQYAASRPRKEEAPYWAIVWEASMALGAWILEHPECVRGHRVLELGCGLGLSGLAATAAGAHLTQTDKIAAALQVAAASANLNDLLHPAQFQADWMAWNHDTTYEVIIGADLVYEPGVNASLAAIFERNLAPGGLLLLSAPLHREPAVALIGLLQQQGWTMEHETRRIRWQRRTTPVAIWSARRGKQPQP